MADQQTPHYSTLPPVPVAATTVGTVLKAWHNAKTTASRNNNNNNSCSNNFSHSLKLFNIFLLAIVVAVALLLLLLAWLHRHRLSEQIVNEKNFFMLFSVCCGRLFRHCCQPPVPFPATGLPVCVSATAYGYQSSICVVAVIAALCLLLSL